MADTSRLLPIKLTDQDGTEKLLLLAEGDKSITETYVNPENLWKPGTPTPYSDFDPSFAHVTQNDWVGGRGLEIFNDDPSRYYDGTCWTLSPNKLTHPLQWHRARGVSSDEFTLPGDVHFAGADTTEFTASTTFTAERLYIWVKRSRGWNLQATINVTGESQIVKTFVHPDGSALSGDWFSEFIYADLASLSIESGDTVSIALADVGPPSGQAYTVGRSAVTGENKTYYLIRGTPTKRKWLMFEYRKALYAVDVRDDGSNSTLLINGDRGKATSGAATTLTDTAKAWTADQWIGAWVIIESGTGVGQTRAITDNGTNSLTVATWDINPDNTSNYVIYKTPYWTTIGTTGLGTVKDVTVSGDLVYFAQGESDFIRGMQWYGTSHRYDDEATYASLISTYTGGGDELVIAVKDSDGIGRHALATTYGNDLSFVDYLGRMGLGHSFTNILEHDRQLYFFKGDGVWVVDSKLRVQKLEPQLSSMPERSNGQAVASIGPSLYFNWISSIERLTGSTLDDIDPNRDAGLPENRRGTVSAMVAHPAGLLFSIDGGDDNYSSIQFLDGTGFHELVRAPIPGWRIRNLCLQPNPDTSPYLWFDMDGDLYYVKLPKHTINPLQDSTVDYMHEGLLDTATFDLSARTLKKLFKEFSIISKQLSDGVREVGVYYQKDEDIGSSDWEQMNEEYYDTSPYQSETFPTQGGSSLSPALGNVHAVRIRLKLTTSDSDTPAIIEAYTLKGFARVPLKRQWTIRVKLADWIQRKGGVVPTTFLDWLDTKASSSEVLRMTSEHYRLDGVDVVPVPQVFHTSRIDINNDTFDGILVLTLREL